MKSLLAILTLLTALNTAGIVYLVSRNVHSSEVKASQSTLDHQAPELRISIPDVSDHDDVAESSVPFYDRPVGEKISQATVIFMVRYEPEGDQMLGIVDRILKKENGVDFYYDEGDRYASADFTPTAGESRGDGMVNFCLGNPASMSCGSSIHHGRIPGLGDIKVEDFIELVEEAKKSNRVPGSD